MPVTRTSTERDKRQAERELRPLWKARKHVFSGSTTSSVDDPLGIVDIPKRGRSSHDTGRMSTGKRGGRRSSTAPQQRPTVDCALVPPSPAPAPDQLGQVSAAGHLTPALPPRPGERDYLATWTVSSSLQTHDGY
ncbi:hypothetical protein B0H14DRAFT_3432195 [Mycena olivaceomarginata]|nr:hypothetical protein B0H14DRAFT_3432195 [Mycena olivaceomarginata]